MRKNTMQKTLILDAVKSFNTHPTADEIYEEVRKVYNNISKGTVYRNLNNLVEEGLVSRVAIDGSADRFECAYKPHYHLKCQKCGVILDVNIPYMKELDSEAEKLTGFKMNNHNTTFFGLCSKCK